MAKPFRWDVRKREQLGKLIAPDAKKFPPRFRDELMVSSARILSFSEDSALTFIGRSPESLFDYLSGVLLGTEWERRISLLNFSMRYYTGPGDVDTYSLKQLRDQFRESHIAPSDIIAGEKKVAFVDLVYTGETFGNLSQILLDWAKEQRIDVPSFKRKVRFIGLTIRQKTSPNTWRWNQNVEWIREYKDNTAKNVSISTRFWKYLGNTQDKASISNTPWRWGTQEMTFPPREETHINGLNIAYDAFLFGQNSRREFTDILSRQSGMKEELFRHLVSHLRRLRHEAVKVTV
jgi:hypothetical protein